MPTLKNLLGGWKLIESENYDALFQKMGLNWFIRKMAARGKPDTEWEALEIGAGGDPVLLRQRNLSKCKPSEITFRIGEPFKDEIFNGKKIVSVVTVERDDPLRLVRKSTDDSEVKLTAVWELQTDGTLLATIQIDEVVAKRRYEKKKPFD